MAECKDLSFKYLRFLSSGIQIQIDRAGKSYRDFLSYKKNGGMEKTLKKAREKRDLAHIELFGVPISKGFYHVLKKTNCSDGLPPGLSIGKSRGVELYIVASWIKDDGRVARKRFNIKKLSRELAISKAMNFITSKRKT